MDLYNYGARMYEPRWGRFVSPDEEVEAFDAGGLNRYSYVANSPLSWVDPDGRSRGRPRTAREPGIHSLDRMMMNRAAGPQTHGSAASMAMKRLSLAGRGDLVSEIRSKISQMRDEAVGDERGKEIDVWAYARLRSQRHPGGTHITLVDVERVEVLRGVKPTAPAYLGGPADIDTRLDWEWTIGPLPVRVHPVGAKLHEDPVPQPKAAPDLDASTRQGSQGSRKGAAGAVFGGVRNVAQSIAYDAYLSNDQSYQFN